MFTPSLMLLSKSSSTTPPVWSTPASVGLEVVRSVVSCGPSMPSRLPSATVQAGCALMRAARARACFKPRRGGLFIERVEHQPVLFVFRRRDVGVLKGNGNLGARSQLGPPSRFSAPEKQKE